MYTSFLVVLAILYQIIRVYTISEVIDYLLRFESSKLGAVGAMSRLRGAVP